VNIRSVSAAVAVIALLLVIVGSILTVTWATEQGAPFTNYDLAEALFNSWGPTLIVVGALLFASMMGGVFIAQEEKE